MRGRSKWSETEEAQRLPPFKSIRRHNVPGSTFKEVRLPNGSIRYEIDRSVTAHNAIEDQEIVDEVIRVFEPAKSSFHPIQQIPTLRPSTVPYRHITLQPIPIRPSSYRAWLPSLTRPQFPVRFQQGGDLIPRLNQWPPPALPGHRPCDRSCCCPPQIFSNCSWPNCPEPSCCLPPSQYRPDSLRFPTHPSARYFGTGRNNYESRCPCGCYEVAAARYNPPSLRYPWTELRSNQAFIPLQMEGATEPKVIYGGSYRPFGHSYEQRQSTQQFRGYSIHSMETHGADIHARAAPNEVNQAQESREAARAGGTSENWEILSIHTEAEIERADEALPQDIPNKPSGESEENLLDSVQDCERLPRENEEQTADTLEGLLEETSLFQALLESSGGEEGGLEEDERKNERSDPECPLLSLGPGSPLFSSPRQSPEFELPSPELSLPQLSPFCTFDEV